MARYRDEGHVTRSSSRPLARIRGITGRSARSRRSWPKTSLRRPADELAESHFYSALLLRVIAVYAKLKIAAAATLITHRIQSMPRVLPPPRSPHSQ